MDRPFLFPPCEKWDNLSSFIDSSENLPLTPFQRHFLSAGGTLTTALYALLTSPVHISVIRQNLMEADPNQVRFLDLKEGEKGVLREIWILSQRDEKLVYANSFLPLNGLSPSVHEAVLTKKYSIGDLIEKLKLPSFKDKIGFGTLQSESLSMEFRDSDRSLLWYRHFRLSSPHHILASIYEVFSPTLFKL